MSSTLFARVVSIIVAALLAGCTSAVDLTPADAVPPSEGVVFGRVKMVWKGETKTLTSMLGESTLSVVLLADGSSNATSVPLRDDGSFYWHLPPGGYTIAGFEGLTPDLFSRRMKGRIFARFGARQTLATYVGTLTLLFEAPPGYRMVVADDYAQAVKDLADRFPRLALTSQKDLMVLETAR